MRSRKYAVLSARRSRRSPAAASMSNALMPAATTCGGSELENRYGRERWRSSSITSRLAGGESAQRAAHRLAERAGDDVDAVEHALDLGRAAAGRAEEAGRVAFVDMHQRAVFPASAVISSSGAMKPSIENTPSVVISLVARAGGVGRLQLRFQFGHVAVGVAKALGFAQAHAVDDRGVVERIGDDRVFLAEQRLEQAAVGVEAGGVEDGVLRAEEVRDASSPAACAGPACRR